eukprot:IDg23392t1
MAMNPTDGSLPIYNVRADANCVPVRAAVTFALGETSNSDMLAFFARPYPQKSGKPSGLTILAYLSRGQTRAHAHIQSNLVSAFDMHCPSDSPLHPASRASISVIQSFASRVLDTNAHCTSAHYHNAWFQACI